jgi:hypothetical protein
MLAGAIAGAAPQRVHIGAHEVGNMLIHYRVTARSVSPARAIAPAGSN